MNLQQAKKEYEEVKENLDVLFPRADNYIKELEKINKLMSEELKRNYRDMDNIDKLCKLAGVHEFTLMRKGIKAIINKFYDDKHEIIIHTGRHWNNLQE